MTAYGLLVAGFHYPGIASDEFDDWYDTEHIPERLGVKGFINAQRWVAPDGSKAVRLTNGAADEVRSRIVRTNPDEEFIATDKPVMTSLFGVWSKKSGYAKLTPAGATWTMDRLVWQDASVTSLARAKDAKRPVPTASGTSSWSRKAKRPLTNV